MHVGVASQNDWAARRIESFIPSQHNVFPIQFKSSILDQCHDYELDVLFYDVAYATRSQFTLWREISKVPHTDLVLISPVYNRVVEEKALRLGVYDIIAKPWDHLGDDILRILSVIDQGKVQNPKYDMTMRSFQDAIVTIRGKRIGLSQTEFDLLKLLVAANGHYMPTERLINDLWGETGSGRKEDLYVYISRLREKLEENPNRPQLIVSSRGIGYTFNGEVSIERELV